MRNFLLAISLFFPAAAWALGQKGVEEPTGNINFPVTTPPTPDQGLNTMPADGLNSTIEGGSNNTEKTIEANPAPLGRNSPLAVKTNALPTGAPKANAGSKSQASAQTPVQTQNQAKSSPITHQKNYLKPSASIRNSGISEIGELQNAHPEDISQIQSALKKVFDQEKSLRSRAPQSGPPPVPGKTESFFNKIYQTALVAAGASPYDAPKLFDQALDLTKEALKKHVIKSRTAASLKKTIIHFAFKKAGESLSFLLGQSAKAALSGRKKALARGLKAFSEWEELLGSPGRPLIENQNAMGTYLKGLLNRAKTQEPSPSTVNSDLRMEKLNGRFKATLPPFAVQSLALQALSLTTDRSLLLNGTPILAPQTEIGWRAFYRLEKKSSGRGSFYSGFQATRYFAEIEIEKFWRWVLSLVNRFKTPIGVDLGHGLTIESHDPAFQRLLFFEIKNKPAPPQTAWLDLSPINRPYFDFKRAPSFAAALGEAQGYQKLSGDSSGVQGLSDLARGRVASPKKIDPLLLYFWTRKTHDAALVFLFKALKRAAQGAQKPALFADPGSSNSAGMILLAAQNPAPSGLLKRLGFDLSNQSGWTYGLLSKESSKTQETLGLTQKVLSGKITSLPQPRAVALPPLLAQTQKDLSQAIRAYAGLKDNQAFLQWWAGYAQSPMAPNMALTLAANLTAQEKTLKLSPKAVSRLLRAVGKTLPPGERRNFFNSVKNLKMKSGKY